MSTKRYRGFEWDTRKAEANKKKHGVSFEEATTAFIDKNGLTVSDPQGHEDRFVLIGMSSEARILYVVHTEIIDKQHMRIISARVANKKEAVRYSLGDAL